MKFENHFIRAPLLVLGVCCEWMTRGQRDPSLLSGTSWLKICRTFMWIIHSGFTSLGCQENVGCPHTWRALNFVPCVHVQNHPTTASCSNILWVSLKLTPDQLLSVLSPWFSFHGLETASYKYLQGIWISLKAACIRCELSNYRRTWAQVNCGACWSECWFWRLTSRILLLKIPDLRAQVLPLPGCSGLVLHRCNATPHQCNTAEACRDRASYFTAWRVVSRR